MPIIGDWSLLLPRRIRLRWGARGEEGGAGVLLKGRDGAVGDGREQGAR